MAKAIASAALKFVADVSGVAAGIKPAKDDIAGLDKAARAVGRGAAAKPVDFIGTYCPPRIARPKPVRPDRHPAPEPRRSLLGAAVRGGVAGVAAGVGMKALAAVPNPFEAIAEGIDLTGKAEANAVAFEVMAGSVQKAADVIGQIRAYAKESPFGTRDVTEATRGLMAYGVAAGQAVPTVRMLGEVAAAGGDEAPQKFQRLTLAYGQVMTAGKLYGTELRQFTEAGVPLIEALADVMGKPRAQIKGLVEEAGSGRPTSSGRSSR